MKYDLINKIGRSKKGCEADLNTSLAQCCDKI